MTYIAEAPPLPVLGTINNLVPVALFGSRHVLNSLGCDTGWMVLVPTGLIFVISLVLAVLLGIPIVVQTFRGAYAAGRYRLHAAVYYITLLPVLWLAVTTFF